MISIKRKIREYNRNLNGEQLFLHQKEKNLKGKELIDSNEKLQDYFEEVIKIFKSLGYYKKPPFQKDDRELAEILKVNQRTVQRIRCKNGHIPKPSLQERIEFLKRLSEINDRSKIKKIRILIRTGNKIQRVY